MPSFATLSANNLDCNYINCQKVRGFERFNVCRADNAGLKTAHLNFSVRLPSHGSLRTHAHKNSRTTCTLLTTPFTLSIFTLSAQHRGICAYVHISANSRQHLHYIRLYTYYAGHENMPRRVSG